MNKLFTILVSSILIVGSLCLSACGHSGNGGGQPSDEEVNLPTEPEPENPSEEQNIMYIQIGNTTLTATLVDNSSTRALKKLLPLTISMSDYGNFEKVGNLGTTLPRNDEQISTDAGDLILYQGNSFVIYYDTNSWNFTRLGKINNVSKTELKNILGSGDVSVTLSLETE